MKRLNANLRKITFCLLTFSLFAFLTENSIYAQPKEREYWPTKGWKTSIPEKQGMDSAKLLIAEEFIQNRLPDAYSLLVVKNGYLVFEKYYSRGSREKYAAIHQFGGPAGRGKKVNIPARPYLKLGDDDLDEIRDAIWKYLN